MGMLAMRQYHVQCGTRAMNESSDARRWSQSEIDSLRESLRTGAPIAQVASSLQRDVEAVRAKIADLIAERA
jgi:hypothetical protein